jgi:hypothetical protein
MALIAFALILGNLRDLRLPTESVSQEGEKIFS